MAVAQRPRFLLPEHELTPKTLYCRLCLFTLKSDNYKYLFTRFNGTQTIVDVIETFARVQISPTDQHSKLICFDCYDKLTAYDNFKYLIEFSDVTLKNHLVQPKDPLVPNFQFMGEHSHDNENLDIKSEDLIRAINSDDTNNCGGSTTEESRSDINTPLQAEDKINIEEVDLDTTVRVKEEPIDLSEPTADASPRNVKIEYKNEIEDLTVPNNNDDDDQDDSGQNSDQKKMKKKYFFQCPECDKTFTDHQSRKNHSYKHSGIYPHVCPVCNKGFGTKSSLDVHQAIHREIRPYQCEVCGKSFKIPSSLYNHRLVHRQRETFKCEDCEKIFTSNYHLQMHRSVHLKKTDHVGVQCEICQQSFKSVRSRYNHMRRFHKPSRKIPCDLCGKIVTNLNDHMNTHTKPHKCNICEKSFSSNEKLTLHLIAHTEDKAFSCDICTKTFKFPQSLRTHRRLHIEDKRFKCELCEKRFNYKQTLQEHVRNIHQKLEIKNC